MTRDELADTISNSIEQLGFARIPVSAILDVFTLDEQASFTLHDELQEFAQSHGWDFQHQGESFVVFSPKGSEPPPVS